MRRLFARLARSCRNARWEGPAALLLLFAVLAGLAILTRAADELQQKVAWAQTTQTDNTTWLISQLEIEVLKLLQASRPAAGTDPRSVDLEQLRSSYEALASRAETIAVNLDREGWFGAAELQQDWAQLEARIQALAPIVAMPDLGLQAQLPVLITEVTEQADAVRSFSANALMLLGEDSASRRQLQELLHTFLQLAASLILTLMMVAGGTIVLLRRLQIRGVQNDRIKANIEKAIAASMDAVLVADARGRIVTFNSAAQSIFGFTQDEAVGADLASLVIPKRLWVSHSGASAGFNLDPNGPVVNRGRRVLVAKRKDETEFPVEATIVSDQDERDQTTYFAFFRDMSARIRIAGSLKRARDTALRNEEVKSRFLAVMSHEMRTPLNGLVAALDIVTETTELSAKQAHFLRIARSCSLSALEQVNDVLELTLLDEGKLQEEPSDFDVVGLILEIAEQAKPMAERRGNSIRFALPAVEVSHVRSYRRLVGQVLANLLSNAIKFTDSGVVQISARFDARPDGVQILRVEVSDTGIGIAQDKLTRIFDDFETLDGSYSRMRQGTGLGLGIARRAVAFMKGEMGVESRLGEGSAFWFSVPLAVPNAGRLPTAVSEDAGEASAFDPPSGHRVLVAEDNPINREVLREMLECCGHSVTEATNGEDAVALAASNRFDLILMDVSMPRMDGIEASILIRSGGASAKTRVVGLTAHAFPGELDRFRASGMDEVIVKPITLAKVQDFLPGREVMISLQSAAQAEIDHPDAPQPVPLIDDVVFIELHDLLDPAAHVAALNEFDRELSDLLADLRSSPEVPEDIAPTLHRIRGSAAVLGALRVSTLLDELEAAASGDLTALLQAVEHCRSATLLMMRSHISIKAA